VLMDSTCADAIMPCGGIRDQSRHAGAAAGEATATPLDRRNHCRDDRHLGLKAWARPILENSENNREFFESGPLAAHASAKS
jgi:hypothetical protein